MDAALSLSAARWPAGVVPRPDDFELYLLHLVIEYVSATKDKAFLSEPGPEPQLAQNPTQTAGPLGPPPPPPPQPSQTPIMELESTLSTAHTSLTCRQCTATARPPSTQFWRRWRELQISRWNLSDWGRMGCFGQWPACYLTTRCIIYCGTLTCSYFRRLLSSDW